MADRPNIVMILTDDQGAWAMGCAGNNELRTPNLDRLAATGTRCENFFCVSPVCSPARASLLTGRIPSAHGVHDWLRGGNIARDQWMENQPGSQEPIEYLAGMPGYSDLLAANGYHCAISGKWHLGDSITPQKGFDRWFVHARGGGPYYGAPMIENGEVSERSEYVTEIITAGGLRFLDELLAADGPFCLSVHYTAPHSPWGPDEHPDEFLELYADCPFASVPDLPLHPWQSATAPAGLTPAKRRENLTGYFAAISAMDAGVGRILDRLDDAGVRENTLIFFTSDNGMNMGHHGLWGKGNASFPLNMYDSSVKVPAIFSQPGTVPEGQVAKQLLSHYDWFPTVLEHAGLDNPEAERLPGQSFAPLLRGESLEGREAVVVYDEYGPVRMVRTAEWKYVHRYPYGPQELYHLVNDPNEVTNLVDEPAQQERAQAMRALLGDWFLTWADPAMDGSREAVTGAGQVDRCGHAGAGRPAFHGRPRAVAPKE